MLFHFATYNVLASSNEGNLQDSSYLSFEVRYPKLLATIKEMVLFNAIIGLQEVDKTFYERISLYFNSVNYTYIYESYGIHGILTAYPKDLYTEVSRKSLKVGEKITELCKDLDKSLCVKHQRCKKSSNAVKEASKRKNILISVRLRREDKEFMVFNYHSPVVFYWIPIMGAHISVVIGEIPEDIPCILLTDLNNPPKSSIYNYITKSKVRKALKIHPNFPLTMCKGLVDVRSELGITGYTTRNIDSKGKPFQDTLDYIFTSTHWRSIGFYQRYSSDIGEMEKFNYIPSLYEGSDHLPIIAVVGL